MWVNLVLKVADVLLPIVLSALRKRYERKNNQKSPEMDAVINSALLSHNQLMSLSRKKKGAK
jgi:hypothetical protein